MLTSLHLSLARFGVDTALFILIWLVQVIIYPSFRYVDPVHFEGWHARYMGLITYFVGPLMLLQVGIIIAQWYTHFEWIHLASALAILLVWWTTATLSIPCHSTLQASGHDLPTIDRLVFTNWYRTLLWTLTLGLSLWHLYRHGRL